MEVVANNYLPGDQRLVDKIVYELKAQGIFDQFRKECFADVDTKPAYQNLRQRVENNVTGFLKEQSWRPDMNKNQVREMLRKRITESGYLETGVERIVDQVVNPKINSVFLPKVEEVVYKYLGIEKPNRDNTDNKDNDNNKNDDKATAKTSDLLPQDLEAISPESVSATEKKDDKNNNNNNTNSNDNTQDLDDNKMEEDESPPFEPLEEQSVYNPQEDNSIDSHMSGFSGLISHESNFSSDNKPIVMDLNQQDSQMSRNSSESHLSIVTSDENSKMDICDDSQSKSIKSTDSYSKIDDKKDDNRNKIDKNKQKTDKKDDKDRDRERKSSTSSSSKDSKSRHSSSHNSRDRDRNRDHRDSKSSKIDKDRSKDKDKDKKSGSSSSKHNSKDRDRNRKESSSKDRERDKNRSSSSHHDKDSKKSSDSIKKSEKSRNDKSSHSSDRSKKDKDRKKDSKPKDDHYSSRDKKNDRRSADRDSNGGNTGSSTGSNNSSTDQSNKQSNDTNSTKSNNNSGDSNNSGNSEQKEEIVNNKSSTIKLIKPKFASNIKEAMKLMKIRKQLAKLEKQNQLGLTSVDVNSKTLISSSICLEDIKPNGFIEKVDDDDIEKNTVVISQENWDRMEAKLNEEILKDINCRYFDNNINLDEYFENFKKFVSNEIEKFNKFKRNFQSKKRNFGDFDYDNNNERHEYCVKKPKLEKRNNFSDILQQTPESFPLPLSPAESDNSIDKKEATPPLKPKRSTINKNNNQRYSSDDLYKPRPTFACSRRRGAKTLDN